MLGIHLLHVATMAPLGYTVPGPPEPQGGKPVGRGKGQLTQQSRRQGVRTCWETGEERARGSKDVSVETTICRQGEKEEEEDSEEEE